MEDQWQKPSDCVFITVLSTSPSLLFRGLDLCSKWQLCNEDVIFIENIKRPKWAAQRQSREWVIIYCIVFYLEPLFMAVTSCSLCCHTLWSLAQWKTNWAALSPAWQSIQTQSSESDAKLLNYPNLRCDTMHIKYLEQQITEIHYV